MESNWREDLLFGVLENNENPADLVKPDMVKVVDHKSLDMHINFETGTKATPLNVGCTKGDSCGTIDVFGMRTSVQSADPFFGDIYRTPISASYSPPSVPVESQCGEEVFSNCDGTASSGQPQRQQQGHQAVELPRGQWPEQQWYELSYDHQVEGNVEFHWGEQFLQPIMLQNVQMLDRLQKDLQPGEQLEEFVVTSQHSIPNEESVEYMSKHEANFKFSSENSRGYMSDLNDLDSSKPIYATDAYLNWAVPETPIHSLNGSGSPFSPAFNINLESPINPWILSNDVALTNTVENTSHNLFDMISNSPHQIQSKTLLTMNSITQPNTSGNMGDTSLAPPVSREKVLFDAKINKTYTKLFSPYNKVNCPLCGIVFPRRRFLAIHIKSHGANKIYKCSVCDCSFNIKVSLDKHNIQAHGPPMARNNILDQQQKDNLGSPRTHEPSPWTREPSPQIREPSPRTRENSTRTREPRTRIRKPSLRTREPSTRTRKPSTRTREPRPRTREPSTRTREPSTQTREPSIPALQQSIQTPLSSLLHTLETSSAPEVFLVKLFLDFLEEKKHQSFLCNPDCKMSCQLCGVSYTNEENLVNHTRSHGANKRYRCTKCDCSFKQKVNTDDHSVLPQEAPIISEVTQAQQEGRDLANMSTPGPIMSTVLPSAPSVPPSAPTVQPSVPTVPPSAPTVQPSIPTVPPSAPTVQLSIPTVQPSAQTLQITSPDTLEISSAQAKLFFSCKRKRKQSFSSPDYRVNCQLCGVSCTNVDDHVNHTRSHGANKRYRCTKCDCSFKQKVNIEDRNLLSHEAPIISEVTVAQQEGRDLGSMSTPGPRNSVDGHGTSSVPLLSQENVHSNYKDKKTRKRPFNPHFKVNCPLCSITYANKGHLKNHMKCHGAKRYYSCSMCDCSFNKDVNLVKHNLRAHTGSTPRKSILAQQQSNKGKTC
ncbi:zinc finger protein 48 [Procambarus clarkii]|uniref:zinc finger protein 48 n=1 Tax=Procambarus clarkii TaxID=6728 RepID=UPI0037427F36